MGEAYEVGDFIWAYYEVLWIDQYFPQRISNYDRCAITPFVWQGEGWFEAEIEEVEGDSYYTVFYHEYDDSVAHHHVDDIRPVSS